MCVIPSHVEIIIPSNGADRKPTAVLNLQFRFNGKTEGLTAGFNCEANLPGIAKYWKEQSGPALASIMKWNKDKIFFFNSCQNEQCFYVSGGYKKGWPWGEPKGCERAQHFEPIEQDPWHNSVVPPAISDPVPVVPPNFPG